MRKRTYRSVTVKQMDMEQLGVGHDRLILGCDAAKEIWYGAWMNAQGEVLHTIRWDQVDETGELLTRLGALHAAGVAVEVAVEPTAMESRTSERRDGGRIRCAAPDGAQHASSTQPEEIRHQTRHFHVHFLEQALQPVPQLHAITRQLKFAPSNRPRQTLRHIGHEAEGQLVGDQAFHEAFRIGNIFLPAARTVVRLRLCQMQRTGRRCRVGA